MCAATSTPPLTAQRTVLWQAQTLVTTAADPFVGAGVGVGVRSSGRFGAGASVNAGTLDSQLAVRSEGVVSFHMNPRRTNGVSLYAVGGIAVEATDGFTREFLLFALGLDHRPRSRRGWFVEAGVGGGLRLTAGFRFRRFPAD